MINSSKIYQGSRITLFFVYYRYIARKFLSFGYGWVFGFVNPSILFYLLLPRLLLLLVIIPGGFLGEFGGLGGSSVFGDPPRAFDPILFNIISTPAIAKAVVIILNLRVLGYPPIVVLDELGLVFVGVVRAFQISEVLPIQCLSMVSLRTMCSWLYLHWEKSALLVAVHLQMWRRRVSVGMMWAGLQGQREVIINIINRWSDSFQILYIVINPLFSYLQIHYIPTVPDYQIIGMQYILAYYNIKHSQQMQVLEIKLKLVIEWIINKKNSIYSLVTNHLPIYRAIKEFVESYLKFMNEIVTILHKIIKDLTKNSHDQSATTLLQLFDLVRQKEIINIQQWEERLSAIDNKYQNNTTSSNKPFPDIFKHIDSDVDYYHQLRSKLNQTISQKNKKNYHTLNQNHTASSEKLSLSEQQRQRQLSQKNTKKTDTYANLYDQHYVEKQKQRNEVTKLNDKIERHVGRIRTNSNYGSVKSAQLTSYRLVNPRFSPNQQQYSYSSTQPEAGYRGIDGTYHKQYIPKCNTLGNQKYDLYKAELYQDMKKESSQGRKPKYTAQMYLNQNSPIRKFEKINQPIEYSTANSDRYSPRSKYSTGKKVEAVHSKYEEHDRNKGNKTTGKKYQYLFDQDREFQGSSLESVNQKYPISRNLFTQKSGKHREAEYPRRSYKFYYDNQNYHHNESNNDSLEQQTDRLGSELQIDMPTIFKRRQEKLKQSNLQQLLADSLMSSKKWDSNDEYSDGQSSQGEKDSLEDDKQIQQTGKFKLIHYTDEDQQLFPQNVKAKIVKNSPKNYLSKQISTESNQLNMSFGRN